MSVRATWKGVLIAESDDIVMVEGNAYFPRDAVLAERVRPSTHTTVCGWKGLANYLDVVIEGGENRDAAWYYADPKPEAAQIRGRVAFWRGVSVGS